MGYKGEVIADSSGNWAGNALVFPSEAEAKGYLVDLARRWTLVQDTRVVEVDEEPNYKWVDGRPERIA
jgi:hypothetical protein